MRRSPLKRRTRLRAKVPEPMAPEEREAARLFRHAVVHGKVCVVCGRMEPECRRGSPGRGGVVTVTRLHAHHVVSKQRLRRLGLERLYWDPRNGVAACDDPCHRRHTNARRRIRLAELPPTALDFAREHGLMYDLEREYAA